MKLGNEREEALAIKKSIIYVIKEVLYSETKNCVRELQMEVVTLAVNGFVGVKEPYSTTINLPYMPSLVLKVKDAVVVRYSGSLNNARVVGKVGEYFG